MKSIKLNRRLYNQKLDCRLRKLRESLINILETNINYSTLEFIRHDIYEKLR